ncbi:MAG TPA: hypothetical protein VMR21_03215 [Vicinamibacteria bacterium]|nr:hypothetical protein [Vicinamibacteria bacterium]
MKLVAAGIVLLLVGSSAAEAGLLSRKPKLPKPIDSPIVRPKVREDHKVGKRTGQHPKRLEEPTHGNEWDKIFNLKHRHGLAEYLKPR